MKQVVLLFVQAMVLCILASGHAWTAAGKEGRWAQVDPALVAVYEAHQAYLERGSGAAFTPSNPLLSVIEERVVVDAVASGDVHALQDDLVALGMQGAVAFGPVVSGQLAIAAMEDMATL